MPARKRQSIVPDYLVNIPVDGPVRPLWYGLKTLHYGPSTYPESAARCQAVGRRAMALPTEYANKARRADRTFCNTPV